MKGTMSEKAEPALPSNAFMTVLQQHARGETCQQLADGMRECIEAVSRTGKAATMTLKVKFEPAGRGSAFAMDPEVLVKVPKSERPSSLWFADDAFNLHREDPKQATFDLQTVKKVPEADPAEVRKLAGL